MNIRVEAAAKVLRCAVYTRKSSEEGLEQSFNSLHAQREACEAYIKSQVSEGWSCLPTQYDDGGVSGGTMERPGLKQLLADIAADRVDVVVVYKVDRLTRSLGDFARIVEQFDAAGVSFVSVTQAFNTTTSMGRLTLNVLLSFAQFEREVTGERIRDKLALSKARGMWMGSVTPLGYDKGDHVLLVNTAEAETVRTIYRRYLEVGSVHVLCAELKAQGVRSKRWVTSKGRELGGAVITRGALFYLLQNRHYLGEIPHKGINHPGLHPAIVDPAVFAEVQDRLAENRVVRRTRRVKAATHLLTGRIYDGEGRRFSPTFSTGRNGRIHRYYVRSDIQLGREVEGSPEAIRRIGADALESFILREVRKLTGRPNLAPDRVLSMLKRVEVRPSSTHILFDREELFDGEHPEFAMAALQQRLEAADRLDADPGSYDLRLALPRRMKLRGGRSWSSFAGDPPSAKTDPTIVDGLQRAHALTCDWRNDERSDYRRRLRTLAFLAPDIQRAILANQMRCAVNLSDLISTRCPLLWSEQRMILLARSSSG